MKLRLNIAALGRSRWHEYVVRFVFGGVVTSLAGIIAKQYGPEVGGLFMAFPAIFPAAATLVQKHEKQDKERVGESGIVRGRAAAGAEAAGAAIGSLGLIAFAVIIWRWIAVYDPRLVLAISTITWFLVAALVWEARNVLGRQLRLLLRKRRAASNQPLH